MAMIHVTGILPLLVVNEVASGAMSVVEGKAVLLAQGIALAMLLIYISYRLVKEGKKKST
ncbi:MAG: hypothetical protein A2748_02105 [Candidatus Wildermuthbacteria bacterium RIFCSPHIGHO2_01_FULL_45_20]|uniref:Uncharacterized protein n=1 Tax=Candidatus Wildermuthbacteria bacterium RIFCSPHIGHO2_02_FULL_45_25 TaxID=1802450 RepID=A0A1G2QYK4_9BACT|nr:MAG: hypothetical protein A2748_02105 [Candidatus Wildermuthbacteria bacterium RIFCSPHIGHO2_01_FULL_45_20]OHA65714.1 MAG: hypothetical protein A3C04_02250 [Candidatus Wildermuthbacteria bacterium RIFCSPHIGHO2_02_FULL_45_25]